jgi:ribonuclease-3
VEIISLFKNIFNKKSNLRDNTSEIGFFTDIQKSEIQQIIGVEINDWSFIEQGFSHKSVVADSQIALKIDNQRLEYLGDSILGAVISDYLYHNYGQWREGELTKLRSVFVKNSTLAKIGIKLGLDKFLIYGSHAENNLDKGYESIVSDLVEATVAAIYLDSGFDNAKKFVMLKLLPFMTEFEHTVSDNYKSMLLEKCQMEIQKQPRYEVIEESGPDHNKEFFVAVYVNNIILAKGRGKSKKAAEQEAAKIALSKDLKNI